MPRVIVIDDDLDLLAGLRDALRVAGYDVLGAANGQDGLRLMRESKPDVLITDLLMPGTGGLAVIATCRMTQAFAAIPIVAMSGNPTLADAAIQMGADIFLLKPFTWQRAIDVVAELLNRASGER
jgi:DNA-binding response OmpR family regulator